MAAPAELKELGRGTFGRVYKAFDETLGRHVAVKELLDPDTELERFEREVRLLSEQGNNQYVVRILSWDMSPPRPYFVMEYCDGGSLAPWAGKATWQQTATMLFHAANGLAGIHGAGGFHRDLKLLNLLLSSLPNGSGYILKIADFGLARRPRTAKPPMTTTPGGTPGYMAPELSLPGGQFSVAADIYSLGIVGIELLTGALSPTALTNVALPIAFRNLLLRMASPHQWIRPATADLIIALSHILGIVPPSESIAPGWPPPSSGSAAMTQGPAPPTPPQSAGGGGLGLLLLALGGMAAGAAALAAGNRKDWDEAVGRYRGKDGRFRG